MTAGVSEYDAKPRKMFDYNCENYRKFCIFPQFQWKKILKSYEILVTLGGSLLHKKSSNLAWFCKDYNFFRWFIKIWKSQIYSQKLSHGNYCWEYLLITNFEEHNFLAIIIETGKISCPCGLKNVTSVFGRNTKSGQS